MHNDAVLVCIRVKMVVRSAITSSVGYHMATLHSYEAQRTIKYPQAPQQIDFSRVPCFKTLVGDFEWFTVQT